MVTLKKAEVEIIKTDSGLYFMVSEGQNVLISEELAKLICKDKTIPCPLAS